MPRRTSASVALVLACTFWCIPSWSWSQEPSPEPKEEDKREDKEEEPQQAQPPSPQGEPSGEPVPDTVGAPDQRKIEEQKRAANVEIFNQRGILTQPGKLVLEPSLQYTHSSVRRLAIEGYTVIPAITIGLIDLRDVNRETAI